jgi:hypothetical protein
MAQVIAGGNAAVQALLYGEVHPGTDRFFENQRGTSFGTLTQSAATFAREAIEKFGFMASDRTKRLIGEVRRAASWAWHGDYIRPLRTPDEIQLAAPRMIRYVMADPVVRRMYQKQTIAGYDDRYVDCEPGAIGEDHRDYRRVMDGIVVVDEHPNEDGDIGWHADTWADDLLEDEKDLEFSEQMDILETWACVRRSIAERLRDPTSIYGASLE